VSAPYVHQGSSTNHGKKMTRKDEVELMGEFVNVDNLTCRMLIDKCVTRTWLMHVSASWSVNSGGVCGQCNRVCKQVMLWRHSWIYNMPWGHTFYIWRTPLYSLARVPLMLMWHTWSTSWYEDGSRLCLKENHTYQLKMRYL